MTFDRQIPLGQGGALADEPRYDVGFKPSGGEQTCLYRHRLDLLADTARRVEVHGVAVGPRRLAGLRGCHGKRTARDGGGHHRQPLHAVHVVAHLASRTPPHLLTKYLFQRRVPGESQSIALSPRQVDGAEWTSHIPQKPSSSARSSGRGSPRTSPTRW